MRRGIIYILFTHCLFQLKFFVRSVATVFAGLSGENENLRKMNCRRLHGHTVCVIFFRLKILNHEYYMGYTHSLLRSTDKHQNTTA